MLFERMFERDYGIQFFVEIRFIIKRQDIPVMRLQRDVSADEFYKRKQAYLFGLVGGILYRNVPYLKRILLRDKKCNL